ASAATTEGEPLIVGTTDSLGGRCADREATDPAIDAHVAAPRAAARIAHAARQLVHRTGIDAPVAELASQHQVRANPIGGAEILVIDGGAGEHECERPGIVAHVGGEGADRS